MNALYKNNGMKKAAGLAVVLAVAFGFSARAAYDYTYNFSDSGPIPVGGTTSFSVEQTVSGAGNPISSVALTLTFNNGYDLSGSILGSLILNPGGSATSVSFTPSVTSSGVGSQEIYTAYFSGPPTGSGFNTLNPNSIWALNLWDTGTGPIENGLVSWSLDIGSPQLVPEPVTYALALFGLVFVGGGVGRFYLGRRREKA